MVAESVSYGRSTELIQALTIVRTICLEGWRNGCLKGSELMVKDCSFDV